MNKSTSIVKTTTIVALALILLLCAFMLAACGKQIKELQVDLTNVETTYIVGSTDALDLTNLKLNVIYDDDSTEVVDTTSSDLKIDTSTVNLNTIGTYSVKLQYKGVDASFNINVISGMLLVDRSAIPLSVAYGSVPDWSSIVVKFYNETTGEYDVVSEGDYILNTSNYDSQELGAHSISVTYSGYTYSFSVTVIEPSEDAPLMALDGDTYVIFNSLTYNLTGGADHKLFLSDNSTEATEGFTLTPTSTGATLNISKNGDYVLHYTNNGVERELKFRSIDYLSTFNTGADWQLYRASVEALGTDTATFMNPEEQPYLVGTANPFHFDFSMTSAGGNGSNVVADENLLYYTFYTQSGDTWTEITDTSSLFTLDGEDFTFLNGANNVNLGKVYKAVVAPRYQNDRTPVEFVFTLNDGVNVFTNEDLKENFANLNVETINIHRNIVVSLDEEQFNSDDSLVNISMTNDRVLDPVEAASEQNLLSTTRDEWLDRDLWIIYNTDGTLLHNYTGVPYVRFSAHTTDDNLVINGNYMNIDGTDLPLIDPAAIEALGAERRGQSTYLNSVSNPAPGDMYTVNSQVNIFSIGVLSSNYEQNIANAEQAVRDYSGEGLAEGASAEAFNQLERNETTFNNLSITSNGQVPGGDLNSEENAELVKQKSGSHSAIKVQSDLVANNLVIRYACIGLYASELGADMDVDYTYISDTWANGIYYYEGGVLDMSNTYVGASGGTAVWLEDQHYMNGGLFDPYPIYDSTVVIDNYVSGSEPWFVAQNVSAIVSSKLTEIQAVIKSLSNNEKDFITKKQGVTGEEFNVFNFALVIVNKYSIPQEVTTSNNDYPKYATRYSYNDSVVNRPYNIADSGDPRIQGGSFAGVLDDYITTEAFLSEATTQGQIAGGALNAAIKQMSSTTPTDEEQLAASLINQPGYEVAKAVYDAVLAKAMSTPTEDLSEMAQVAFKYINVDINLASPDIEAITAAITNATGYTQIYQSFVDPDNHYIEINTNVPTQGQLMIVTEFFDAEPATAQA